MNLLAIDSVEIVRRAPSRLDRKANTLPRCRGPRRVVRLGIALAESADGMLLLRIPRALAERKLIESLHGAAEVDDNTVTIRLPDSLVADLVLAASSRVSVDNHGDHFTIGRASGVRTHQHVSRYIHVALMRTNASAVARYLRRQATAGSGFRCRCSDSPNRRLLRDATRKLVWTAAECEHRRRVMHTFQASPPDPMAAVVATRRA